MSKQIKATLDEIVEAVFKELPMGSSPYLVSEVDIALRTALEKFVVEEDDEAKAKSILEKSIKLRGLLDFGNYSCVGIPYENALSAVKLALTTTPKKGGEDEG